MQQTDKKDDIIGVYDGDDEDDETIFDENKKEKNHVRHS